MSARRTIYRWLARWNDAEALASGDSRRLFRRAKNRMVGRALGRAGFWKWLWK
jgi:hypothetical protein